MDDSLYKKIVELKNFRGKSSFSSIVRELIKDALEIQDDIYFTKIAKEREQDKDISHRDIWK